jgi:replicative DNA helicase
MFFNKELFIQSMNRGTLPVKVFSDKSYRLIFQFIQEGFLRQGSLPTMDILKAKVNRLSTKAKDSAKFQEKIYSVLDTIFSEKPSKEVYGNFDVYTNEILLLYQARSLQEHVMKVGELLEKSEVEEAQKAVQTFSVPLFSEDIEEGEYTESFTKREAVVLEKMKNPDKYALMSTGIGVLDAAMGGGVGNEFFLISGNSNSGKSFMLQTLAVNGYRAKKNVILFTIEMQFMETMNRIDNILTGLGADFWRNPVQNWTKDSHLAWRKKVVYAHKNYGKIMVVAFGKGATTGMIEAKAYEIMNKWQKPLHGMYIDYLDDIEAVKSKEKDWRSFGEVAWDMHQFAKGYRNFNGVKGVPTFSAIQQKKSSKEVSASKDSRKLDERDVGSSPLPFRIADIVVGIKNVVDEVYSVLEFMKGRDFGKNRKVDIFHNFSKGKFHDPDLKDQVLKLLTKDEKDEIKKLEEMEINLPGTEEV